MGMTSTPVLTTIHGFSSPKILPVYQKYNRRAYYVAISDADRSPALDYSATIYHGIDLHQFTFRPEPGTYLLFFGRIHPDKGAREAVAIAQKFGMPLIMAGIVQDQAYFTRHVEPYIDGKQVMYVGSVGPVQRNDLLGGAYALLHPINFDEPFGLSVIEAMACGTPVIACHRGSMPEVIAHRRTGFLVNSANEAIKALSHIPELKRTTCREWVEARFSVDRMVEDYSNLYKQIIPQHRW
jgi:glycosyltransferase involved in cell wall biosynthesis